MAVSPQHKRAAFRRLHEQGTFVLPNPWDLGSLRRLEKLGARAVASSSAAYAWSRGRADYQLACEDVLAHLRELVAATDLPVNADFESGFADAPAELRANVERAVATGIAGLSIEDRSGDALYPLARSVERLRAARAAIDATGEDVILVGRSEGLLTGTVQLAEVIDRLDAYAAAGADVVYAPGLRRHDDIRALVERVAPTPVNVLLMSPEMRVADLAALGVRRVSTGSRLAAAAWRAFEAAAESVLLRGQLPG